MGIQDASLDFKQRALARIQQTLDDGDARKEWPEGSRNGSKSLCACVPGAFFAHETSAMRTSGAWRTSACCATASGT